MTTSLFGERVQRLEDPRLLTGNGRYLDDLGRDALAAGYLGAAINSLRTAGIIEHTGRMVPSTNPTTHGHRIAIWRLSLKGHAIAAARPGRAAGEVAA